MSLPERDVYLRNHVLGILSAFQDKGIGYENLSDVAGLVTESILDADRRWHEDSCAQQMMEITELKEKDVPQ